MLSELANHQGMISLFCFRSHPKEELILAAKLLDDSGPPAAPETTSRMPLFRLEDGTDCLLLTTRSDSVEEESVDVLLARAMLLAEAVRDGMFWWLLVRLLADRCGGREPEEAACFKACRDWERDTASGFLFLFIRLDGRDSEEVLLLLSSSPSRPRVMLRIVDQLTDGEREGACCWMGLAEGDRDLMEAGLGGERGTEGDAVLEDDGTRRRRPALLPDSELDKLLFRRMGYCWMGNLLPLPLLLLDLILLFSDAFDWAAGKTGSEEDEEEQLDEREELTDAALLTGDGTFFLESLRTTDAGVDGWAFLPGLIRVLLSEVVMEFLLDPGVEGLVDPLDLFA